MRYLIFAAALAAVSAPAAAQQPAAEIHTFHCLHGCPIGAAETNDLVVREIYTLSSNDLTKFADWVYQVTPETVGSGESRVWRPDPWLDPAETLEPGDYTGAPAALRSDAANRPRWRASRGRPTRPRRTSCRTSPRSARLNQSAWMVLPERLDVSGRRGTSFCRTGDARLRANWPIL